MWFYKWSHGFKLKLLRECLYCLLCEISTLQKNKLTHSHLLWAQLGQQIYGSDSLMKPQRAWALCQSMHQGCAKLSALQICRLGCSWNEHEWAGLVSLWCAQSQLGGSVGILYVTWPQSHCEPRLKFGRGFGSPGCIHRYFKMPWECSFYPCDNVAMRNLKWGSFSGSWMWSTWVL